MENKEDRVRDMEDRMRRLNWSFKRVERKWGISRNDGWYFSEPMKNTKPGFKNPNESYLWLK